MRVALLRVSFHLRAPPRRRRRVDGERPWIQDDAVGVAGDRWRYVTLAHVVRHGFRVALFRRSEAATAARADRDGISALEPLHQHFGVREIGDLLPPDAQGHLVAGAGMASGEAPRRAVHAIDLDVDVDGAERLHYLLGAQAAAIASRAHHRSEREDDFQRTKAALVDRVVGRRGEALVGDLCARVARGGTGVEEAAYLRADLREIDGHLVALLHDAHLDRHAPAELHAV